MSSVIDSNLGVTTSKSILGIEFGFEKKIHVSIASSSGIKATKQFGN
jgi:hypothetical protein